METFCFHSNFGVWVKFWQYLYFYLSIISQYFLYPWKKLSRHNSSSNCFHHRNPFLGDGTLQSVAPNAYFIVIALKTNVLWLWWTWPFVFLQENCETFVAAGDWKVRWLFLFIFDVDLWFTFKQPIFEGFWAIHVRFKMVWLTYRHYSFLAFDD